MKRKIKNNQTITILITTFIFIAIIFTFKVINNTKDVTKMKQKQFEKESSIFINELNYIKEDIINDNTNLNYFEGNIFNQLENEFSFKYYNDNYLITIYNENKTYYKDFEKYEYIIDENVLDYFVIDNNSNIFYSYNDINLNSLITYVNNTKKLDNNLTKDKTTYIDKSLIISIYKINNNYSLIEILNKNDFIKPLYLELITFLIIYLITIALIYLFIYYNNYINNKNINKFNKLIFNDFKYIYSIEINKHGKILNYNNNFKKILNKRYKHINELSNESFNFKDITLNINNNDYLFKLYQLNHKYYLINDSSQNKIEKKQKIIYYNEKTSYKNLRSFKKDIELSNNLNTYFIIDVKNYKNHKLNLGKEMSEEIILKLLNYFNEKYKEKTIYHINDDIVIISFENKFIPNELIENVIYKFKEEVFKKYKIDIEFNIAKLYNENIKGLNIYETLEIILNKKKEITTNNILEYSNELVNQIKREENVKQELLNAVENNEFNVYFQPIYNLKNNQIEMFEALIRWDQSKKLEISVDEYIKLLGKTNLIYDITNLTIEKSIEFIKRSNNKNINVSFNLTPKQFLEQGFINKLTNELDKQKVNPNQISVEITEDVFTNEFRVINNKIKTLKDLGIKVFLDDFGTGYSSFKYLNDLDIDVLKLDRSFINNIDTDERLSHIVKGIINLSKDLDLSVVAEGVENKKQVTILKDFNCKYIQGFLISEALNENEALKLINKKYEF